VCCLPVLYPLCPVLCALCSVCWCKPLIMLPRPELLFSCSSGRGVLAPLHACCTTCLLHYMLAVLRDGASGGDRIGGDACQEMG